MKYIIMKYPSACLLTTVSLMLMLQACSNQPDYKTVRSQVITLHDQLMSEDGRAMSNKLRLKAMEMPAGLQKLKNLQPQIDTAVEKQRIGLLIKQLDSVSNAMDDWMYKFNPNVQGESDKQALDYYKAERVKVSGLDSSYKAVLDTSAAYLARFNVKPDTTKAQPMKMKM